MADRYAKGSKAWGICQKSGGRYLRSELVEDGYFKGLLVHPKWKDGPHPQERPVTVQDAMAIRKPSPEISIEPDYKQEAPDLDTFIIK
jgi:hypothetical protein